MSNSCLPVSGAPEFLYAAEHVLLVGQAVGVPRLDEHADPPRDEVAAAAHPGLVGLGAHPHVVGRSRRRSSLLMLFVPSLKPSRLRSVCWAVEVDDVRPKPSCDHCITATPRASRAKLRMTWNATVGSSAHACTHRSPPLSCGCSASPGSAGMSASAAGRLSASPNRSSNSDGPNPTVMVSRDAPRPTASPVSIGGASAAVSTAPIGRPFVICAAAAAQVPSSVATCWRSVVVTSNAAKARRSCAGRGDAGLVRAVERDDRRRAAAAAVFRLGRAGRRRSRRRPRPARRRRRARRRGMRRDVPSAMRGRALLARCSRCRRHGRRHRSPMRSRVRDLAGDPGQRLLHGLHGCGQRALVGARQLRVQPEARRVGCRAVRVDQVVERLELRGDRASSAPGRSWPAPAAAARTPARRPRRCWRSRAGRCASTAPPRR